MCLQNSAIDDLQKITPPQPFNQIRSLHLHWELRYYEYWARSTNPTPPWNNFRWISRGIIARMPQLVHLSIFFSGIIHVLGVFVYEEIIRDLNKVSNAVSPKFLAMRFPWPDYDVIRYNHLVRNGEFPAVMDDSVLPFKVFRPPLTPVAGWDEPIMRVNVRWRRRGPEYRRWYRPRAAC